MSRASRFQLLVGIALVALTCQISTRLLAADPPATSKPAAKPTHKVAQKPAAPAQVQLTAGQTPCAPLGIPMDAAAAKYRGSNTFFLCKENILTGYKNGNIAELSIVCRPESLRAGWKWKIWCNADGTHCGCNKDDATTWLTVGGSSTFAAWNAGEHCTMNGQARPGANGCASW